jgi:hypothetical protein
MDVGAATVDIAAAKLAYDALKFAYGILKDVRLKKKDKKKIDKEAERIIQLATTTEIDTYVAEPKRKRIRSMMVPSAKHRPVGRKVTKRGTAKRRSLMVRKKR